jgi:hypothetical protein
MSLFFIDSFDQDSNIKVQITSSVTTSLFTPTNNSKYFLFVSGTIEDIDYGSLCSEFSEHMSTYHNSTWTYRYDFSEGQLYFTGSAGAQMVFSSSSLAYKIFGMDDGPSIARTYYISQRRPWTTWQSTMDDWFNSNIVYEGRSIVRETFTDDDLVFAASSEDNAKWLSNTPGNFKWLDFDVDYETQSNMFNDYSSSNVPYTFQQHVKQVGGWRPFLIYKNASASNGYYEDRQGTYKLRANESQFKQKGTYDDFYGYVSHPVKTRRLSIGTNFGRFASSSYGTTSTFLPTNISDCCLWLRGDLGVVTSSNGNVVSWTDQVSGNLFVPSGSFATPFQTTLSGVQSIVIPASASLTSSNEIPFYSSTQVDMFIVFMPSAPNTDNNIYRALIGNTGYDLGTSGAFQLLVRTDQFRNWVPQFRSAPGNNSVSGESSVLTNVSGRFNRYLFRIDTTPEIQQTGSYFYDGSIAGTVNGSAGLASASFGFSSTAASASIFYDYKYQIGANGYTPLFRPFSGSVQEVILYNRNLTQTEITGVHSYLYSRYSV